MNVDQKAALRACATAARRQERARNELYAAILAASEIVGVRQIAPAVGLAKSRVHEMIQELRT